MTTSYYLVSVGTGHVLAQNKGGHHPSGVVLENKGDHDDEQKWTVEFGDRPGVVALKCVANGKYMNSPEGSSQAYVGLGDKQWWWISNDLLTPDEACRFRLLKYSDPYLYHQGKAVEKGRSLAVHMYAWRSSYPNNFGFYFVDTATGFEPAAPMPAGSATPLENLVASNYKPHNKDRPKTYYVSLANSGYVLASEKSGNTTKLVLEHKGVRGDEQKWTFEYGDEHNTIALRNVANGEYARCLDRSRPYETCTGDKEWWRMSVGELTAPGAIRLNAIGLPERYFLSWSAGGHMYRTENSKAVMSRLWDAIDRNFSWHIIDTSPAWDLKSSIPIGGATSKEESDAKGKALEEREAALTQKENDQSAELDKKAKELQECQDALDKEEKKRAASKTDFDSKLKALEDREAKLTQKDKDRSAELDKREKEIQDRQDSSEKEGKARDAASTKKDSDRSAELDKKAKELQDRQESLEKEEKDRQAASTRKDSDRSAELDKKAKELQEREDALAQEEKERKAASTKKDSDASAEWDKKMKEVEERQDSLAKEEKDRAASYEKKVKDLQAREDEMAKKDKKQKASKDTPSSKSDKDATAKSQADKKASDDAQRKLDDLKATEQKIAVDRASLEKSQAVFAVQQEQFRKRQKAFEDKKSASQDDASQAKTENAALEKRMAQLEDQLTQMDNARNNKTGKPQANGTDVPSVGCKFSGQKHYKPPRKLGRKVIGIVYE